jgi:hypothetical protein
VRPALKITRVEVKAEPGFVLEEPPTVTGIKKSRKPRIGQLGDRLDKNPNVRVLRTTSKQFESGGAGRQLAK